jgi:integrase/recombinase XerD
MRVNEAIALDRSDFDPDEGVVLVRRAKGSKTRELPLHPSSSDAFAHYLARRTAYLNASVSEALFISPRATATFADVAAMKARRRLAAEIARTP